MNPVYTHPEYVAMVAAMRAQPADRVTPLVCADWLEEHGKVGHAKFIRGCCELPTLLSEGWPNPRQEMYDCLRASIRKHCHEWTAGALRYFGNPTAHDWPGGFLRVWSTFPYTAHSDREIDAKEMKKLDAIFNRQPITHVNVLFTRGTFAPPEIVLSNLAEKFRRFPNVRFTHGALTAEVPS